MVSDKARVSEHDTFKLMTESLEIASSCAKRMGEHRPDQKRAWQMLEETLQVSSKAIWKLAEEAATKSIT
jgi:hypothetical protein